MNKKASIEIEEIVTILKYLALAVIIILIISYLGKYLLDLDFTKIFNYR